MQRNLPRLSVVIPSLGRDACLENTIRDLGAQGYPDWECLVVFQGAVAASLPETLARILGPRLRMFHTREPNASMARNIGLLEARNEVVLFLDDDVEIRNPGFFAAHILHYSDQSVPGVAGQILGPGILPRSRVHWISGLPSSGWLFFPQNYDKPRTVANGGSGNLSVRRDFALAVGGMDAQYEKGAHREESDFCLRVVKRYGLLQYDPEASLVHLGESTGGCRSWGHNSGVHPLHHVCGEWYFILNGLKLGTIQAKSLPLHLYVLLRRQIFNSQNARSFAAPAKALARSIEGLRLARRKIAEGPRLVDGISGDAYARWDSGLAAQ